MNALQYANAAFSSALRVVAYLYLRVLPHASITLVLPTLYALYLGTLYLNPSLPQEAVKPEGEISAKEDNFDGQENGHIVKNSRNSRYAESLSTVLFSLPTPIRRLRLINLALNTIIAFAALDFTVYPYFDTASDVTYTRVGAVYPDRVKIVVRYPQIDTTNATIQVLWRQFKDNTVAQNIPWSDGPLVLLSHEDDWVNTVGLSSLWPNTTYEYRLADLNRTLLPYPSTPIQFRTFPDPRLASGSHFRFLASSCVTPNFPYAPFQGRRIKGFDLLAEYLSLGKTVPTTLSQLAAASAAEDDLTALSSSNTASGGDDTQSSTVSHSAADTSLSTTPQAAGGQNSESIPYIPPTAFMLFLGDFIYADVPVYFGDNEESYRQLYRRNYQSESFRKVYEKLPMFHIYDDHEIINNYAGQGNDTAAPFPNASSAYKLYNGQANYDPKEDDQTYYDFRYADNAFFVMDTRRYRSDIDAEDITSRTMLGDKQLAALYDWLGKVNTTATFKFIVSSVPFTSLWGYEALTDSWAAFEREKQSLLTVLHSVPNIIILSGDRHEFAAIEFNSEHGHRVLEFSTSPLSMFYVPLIRTLRMKSEAVIQKVRTETRSTDEGLNDTVTVMEEIPQEVVLKYVHQGNYKWSTLEVDTTDSDRPVVRFELMADGAKAYKLEIAGTPVKLRSTTALGALVPQNLKGVFDRMGLQPSKWF